MTQLTPEELRLLLERLTEVESEARELRAEIHQRLLDRRRAEIQDRTGQPKHRPPAKRKPRR